MKYLAYVNIIVKNESQCFAIIGEDIETILQNATKYGSEPTICSELFKLNKDW